MGEKGGATNALEVASREWCQQRDGPRSSVREHPPYSRTLAFSTRQHQCPLFRPFSSDGRSVLVHRSHSHRLDSAYADRRRNAWLYFAQPSTNFRPELTTQLDTITHEECDTKLLYPTIHWNGDVLRLVKCPAERASGCGPLLFELLRDWFRAEKMAGLLYAAAVRNPTLRAQNPS